MVKKIVLVMAVILTASLAIGADNKAVVEKLLGDYKILKEAVINLKQENAEMREVLQSEYDSALEELNSVLPEEEQLTADELSDINLAGIYSLITELRAKKAELDDAAMAEDEEAIEEEGVEEVIDEETIEEEGIEEETDEEAIEEEGIEEETDEEAVEEEGIEEETDEEAVEEESAEEETDEEAVEEDAEEEVEDAEETEGK